MDAGGRFLAIAVGDADQSEYVNRYGIFVVDTADAGRLPVTLDVSVPPTPDDGGERFISMRIEGTTLHVDREERYQHWDGTPENRTAPPMAFDLATGVRLTNVPVAAPAVATPPGVSFSSFVLGDSQAEFESIADAIEQAHGHRPESLMECLRTETALLVAYRVTEGDGVRQYLHVSCAGTTTTGRLTGMLGKAGAILSGRFTTYGTTAIFTTREGTHLFVVPLSVTTPSRFDRVYVPLGAANIIPAGPPITRWDALPPAFHQLMKTAPEMRRVPVRYLRGISIETAGGGFLVAVLAFYLVPMLFMWLFELVSVTKDWITKRHGRWEGPIVLGLPVLFLSVCLWFAWRRWQRLRGVAARVASGEEPCGLWLLEDHLIYRDTINSCRVLPRQHVRGIRSETIGRVQRQLVVIEAPTRVNIVVNLLDGFPKRQDALVALLTEWWQDVRPVKVGAP